MSDESVLVQSPAAEEGAAIVVSAGMLLRQAREASGLHVAALAVAMKVPVKKLEALEADRLQDLPDAVFVRALAASVCRTLKIDAAPILSRLPQSAVPKLDSHERGLNTPVRTPRVVVVPSLKAFVAKPSVLLVAVILLAVLAVLFFPEARQSMVSGSVAPVATDAPVAAPVFPPAATDDTPAPAAGAVALGQAATPVATPAATAPAPTAPVAIAPQAPAAPAPVVAASVPATGVVAAGGAAPTGLLVFKASGASWIRVSDSNGTVVFEKTLQAGESAAANGSGMLSVVVGNVAGTEVLLRGKPFQMVDLNQNNVARFEVK